MAFDMLIGNDALRARLADDVRRATLSHAYIIEGAGGSGKKTLAQALCAALVCEHRDGVEFPCRTCLSCRKVFERNSPDVICIGRGDKASIGVDDVRFLRSDALVPPNDGENKVYVIQDADTMTDAAQNALLLTLEEPPPYVLFLLLCENAASLLETVRSRAVRLRMHLVPNDKLWAHLLKNDRSFSALSEDEQKEILLLADGSVGRALILSDVKTRKPLLDRRAVASAYVSTVLDRQSPSALLDLLPSFGNKRESVCALLSDIEMALRDLILLKRTDEGSLRFYTDLAAAQQMCTKASMQTLFSLVDAVDATRRQLLRNANVNLALTSLFFLS